jgi:hypothetical protein
MAMPGSAKAVVEIANKLREGLAFTVMPLFGEVF